MNDEILEKIGDAFDFIVIFNVYNKAIFKKGGKTVSLYRFNSTVMLQPHDSRFGSIRRYTLKNFSVFLKQL